MSFEKPWGNYLLEKIVETTAPEAISYFPQTIAWQLMLFFLIIFMIKKAYQSWKLYQANAYRREALTWLEKCSLTNEKDIRQLPTLLRKTALLAYEVSSKNRTANSSGVVITRRDKITQLSGSAWAVWLDEHCPKTQFSVQANNLSFDKLLSQLAYIPKLDLNDNEFNRALRLLYQQIALWIQHHQLSDEDLQQRLGEQT